LGRVTFGADVLIGGQTLSDAQEGNRSLYISNDSGDAKNSFRLDASDDVLYLVGRSASGAQEGTALVFRTAAAGGGETDRVMIDPNGQVFFGNAMLVDASTKRVAVGAIGLDGTLRVASNSSGGRTTLTLDNGAESGGRSSILKWTANGAGRWELGHDYAINNQQTFYLYDLVAGAARLLVDGAGRVGMGTTSPERKLDVRGDARIDGPVYVGGREVINAAGQVLYG
jgi:hypothetical protein